ncbi:LOW QUALITY PROTEIN: hypothetical protein HID58_049929 [Brassica napus]|uniref:Uncharacterized protein n=1 Tax=Brassica napus TaxID=3708 RepID=A0ABQ8B6D7_BRANA|nr:LOW QUALITY PROTEIN: hypothetical protein HID58_049929 [Brassica napus]
MHHYIILSDHYLQQLSLSCPLGVERATKLPGLVFFATASDQQKMDKKPENPNEETGYATRSDEEGFGGTYGGNQTFQKDNNDKVHENHPDYDKTQGSEAKEKQKARNQT